MKRTVADHKIRGETDGKAERRKRPSQKLVRDLEQALTPPGSDAAGGLPRRADLEAVANPAAEHGAPAGEVIARAVVDGELCSPVCLFTG